MNFPKNDVKTAYERAKKALAKAYSPYSHFKVGASLKIKGKDVYIDGVNIENTSFGATICAERSAIASLISQHGSCEEVEFLVLCTSPSTVPCSLCRQVLIEFCPPSLPIYITSPEKGLEILYTLDELTPFSFNKEEFKRVITSKSDA